MAPFLLMLLGVALAINLVLFVVAYYQKTDKLTDVSYALTFVALVLVAGMTTSQITMPKLVLGALTVVWAERLGTYLLVRVRTFGNDKRLDNIRHRFVAFGRFWLVRALVVWVVSLPTVLALHSLRRPSTLWLTVGVAVWAVGFVVEGVADVQKFRFMLDTKNKGAWVDRGLWHWARHPNYFGEIMVWLGVYVACVTALSLPYALMALASPLLVAGLLLFVSGVPPLEKAANKRWGKNPGYKAYKARTRLLIPLPRR
ncbi:MAG TPA: DUF1295 domain-containing protein [Candidatus Saccharimonadales bacterium]|nr:DUF1295 domain-containing protein [Candidatus Saccharimonadales bacterium]